MSGGGEWDLLKEYFLPDQFVGGWVWSFGLERWALCYCKALQNVGTNGIDIDGSYQNGEAIFPTDFLRPLATNSSSGSKKKDKVNFIFVIFRNLTAVTY